MENICVKKNAEVFKDTLRKYCMQDIKVIIPHTVCKLDRFDNQKFR